MVGLLLGLSVLASAATALAADGDSCAVLGCEPDVQVVYGTTYITSVVAASGPPFPTASGFPGADVIGTEEFNPGYTTVTYAVSNPTTVVVPPKSGSPPTTWGVFTATATFGSITYATPYLTSYTSPPVTCPTVSPSTVTLPPITTTETTTLPPVTSTSYVQLPPVTTTSTETQTLTQTSVSTVTTTTTLPPVTETTTSVSVSVSTLPPVTTTSTVILTQIETKTETESITTTSTSTTTLTSTTTSLSLITPPPVTTTTTETSTVTTTTTTTYCPPPPAPCENRTFKPWTKFRIDKPSGVIAPAIINVNIPANGIFVITDAEYRLERYSVSIKGQASLGITSSIVKSTTAADYCSGTNGDTCIGKGHSNGQFDIPAGQYDIQVEGVDLDPGYGYYNGLYKIVEKCN